ncbi:MAG: efflux RND transporter periplasmic adaptor subunit [Nitrococcus sp.]|nr:efflux RND transporter periplasmic adaptor subunit [Nitrococcus sp.]
MRFRSILAIVVVVIALGLYLGYRVYEHKHNAASLREETLAMAVPEVSVIHAKPAPPTRTITLPGTLRGWREAQIYVRVPGYVKMWYTDYGERVQKGDLLAVIATPRLKAKYRMAKAKVEAQRAKYELAEVTAQRYTNLSSSHAVAKQSITVKKAELKIEKALLDKAKQHLENIEAKLHFKKIVAPFDGVVIERNVTVGDLVNPTGSLSVNDPEKEDNAFTVAKIDKLRLFVSVPQSFGPFLTRGLTADVTVRQYPDRHFTAEFLTVAKGFDEDTRTAVTEFVVENKDHELWPGSYARVQITAPVGGDALIIPSSALVFQEEGTAVAVVTQDNRIHYQPIIVGAFLNAAFKVTEGISKTDRIVNNPSAALLEGDKVRIVTPRPGYVGQPPAEAASEEYEPAAPEEKEPASEEKEPKSKRSAPDDGLAYSKGTG